MSYGSFQSRSRKLSLSAGSECRSKTRIAMARIDRLATVDQANALTDSRVSWSTTAERIGDEGVPDVATGGPLRRPAQAQTRASQRSNSEAVRLLTGTAAPRLKVALPKMWVYPPRSDGR